MTDNECELVKNKLFELQRTIEDFREIARVVKETGQSEGRQIAVADGFGLCLFPDAIFSITDDGIRRLTEGEAETLITECYLLSGGLDDFAAIVQATGAKISIEFGGKELTIETDGTDVVICLQ